MMLRLMFMKRNGFRVLLHLTRTQSATAQMENSLKLQVNVDITSDVVCPWCWVGKKQLDTAVEHLKEDFDFHIRWKPFLLNKQIPIPVYCLAYSDVSCEPTPEEGMPLRDYLQMKFGEGAAEHFLSGQSPIAQHGKAVGITFNPSRLVVPTKKAHILLEHAAREGKQHEMQEVLFRSYFSEGKNVNSEPVLRALLEEVGLDPDKALALLQDKEAVQHFEEGIREALRKGISAVPHFEISLKENPHIKQQFSGAQPVDTFVSVFSRLKVLSKV